MDALDLFQLGRWLTRLAEDAIRPLGAPSSPPGQRLILMDTFAFPDSSVGEIATRTGLPQSYVSTVVARLRDLDALETRPDPDDRRRTLVKVSDSLPPVVAGLGAAPVDELLTEALGVTPADRAAELIAALSEVAACLRVRLGGPGTPEARLREAQGPRRLTRLNSIADARSRAQPADLSGYARQAVPWPTAPSRRSERR